ncbi:MAG: protein-export chaperone SecB [Alphaproteobacteria bacterium]|nr:protein-export chaperone SecB [Alphaproteobacteria bacterium]
MAEPEQPQNTAPSLQVRAQYIKDLSFENPHSPQSLFSATARPNIDVGVDLKGQKLQDDVYEVVVMISARASMDGNSVFLVELSYGGVFQIANIPEEHVERVLMVDAPFIMFPYLRRVISDVTRDGGFPPLMLDPIDFHQLYIANKQRAATPEGS